MIGNLEPEETVMTPKTNNWLGKLSIAIQELGWEYGDEIRVKIGGVANSGIHQAEGANPKWAKPFGAVSYQNDAFIVIENVTRNPFVPSKAPEVKE